MAHVVLIRILIILCLCLHVVLVGCALYAPYVEAALSVILAAHVVMALVITIGINQAVLLLLLSSA